MKSILDVVHAGSGDPAPAPPPKHTRACAGCGTALYREGTGDYCPACNAPTLVCQAWVDDFTRYDTRGPQRLTELCVKHGLTRGNIVAINGSAGTSETDTVYALTVLLEVPAYIAKQIPGSGL